MIQNLEEIQIIGIENTSVETEMVDLEVEGTNNFILENGVITHNSLNILKAVLETSGPRVVSLHNYSHHMVDLPQSFEFTGSVIFDYNEVPKRFSADFEALISRGRMIEVILSQDQIKSIMKVIAGSDKEKQMVTDFIIKNHSFDGSNRLNLRTQQNAFETYYFCKKTNRDWKELLLAELNEPKSKTRKFLYSLIGGQILKKTDLKKILVNSGYCNSVRTAERKILDWIELGELIEKEDRKRNRFVCVPEIR